MAEQGGIEIFSRPSGQHIWLVRAEGGTFLPNFRSGAVVAIGHLDDLGFEGNPDEVFAPDMADTYARMEKAYTKGEEDRSRSLTSHFNQTTRFLDDLKVGDLVITPDEPHYNRLQVGRIIGLPRFDNSPIDITRDLTRGTITRMAYGLRRKVAWGPLIAKDTLPNSLQKALRAQQSISNLDDHWESIYHSIYPVFMNGDDCHFSINIGTEDRVDNYTLTALLSFLTSSEVVSRFADEFDEFSREEFVALVASLADEGKLTLDTKASLMSPGEVWGTLKYLGKNWVRFYFIYSAIFGSDVLGWDGVIDLETRHKLYQVVEHEWKQKSGDQILNRLKPAIPMHDTAALEDATNDETLSDG